MEVCAELGVPEIFQFHAGLALEPEPTAGVNVIAREAADLLRPCTPNTAQTSTYVRTPFVAMDVGPSDS